MKKPTHYHLVTVAHSPPKHWAALAINMREKDVGVSWGDSLGWKQPQSLVKGIGHWLRHHFPYRRCTFTADWVRGDQQDGVSRGIVALNTLKHTLLGEPLWTQDRCHYFRLLEFCGLLEGAFPDLTEDRPVAAVPNEAQTVDASQNEDVTMKTPEPMADEPPPSKPAKDSGQVSAVQEQAMETTPIQPQTSSLKPPSLDPTPAKSTIHPFFKPFTKATAKRPAEEPPSTKSDAPNKPRTSTSNSSPGASRSTSSSVVPEIKTVNTMPQTFVSVARGHSSQSKNKNNEAVTDGTFVKSDAKWSNYKAKMLSLDPKCEFNETDVREIRRYRHSRCGKWFTQSEPYNIGKFKDHLKSCLEREPTRAEAHTSTLDAIGVLVNVGESSTNARSTSRPLKKWPCPGVGEAHDAHIAVYTTRTMVSSAGRVSKAKLAQSMFGASSVTKLSPDEDKAVNRAQTQSHTWRLHHDTKRVFACGKESPCVGDVYAATVEEAEACSNCLNLLKNQQFQTAIQKKPTDDKRIFTPHQYQAAEIGKQFAAIKGLSTPFERHLGGRMTLFETMAHLCELKISG